MVKEAASGNYRQAHGLWVPSGQTLLLCGSGLGREGPCAGSFRGQGRSHKMCCS
jgi:hypothetical protein